MSKVCDFVQLAAMKILVTIAQILLEFYNVRHMDKKDLWEIYRTKS